MQISVDELLAIAEDLFAIKVARELGTDGSYLVKRVLGATTGVHKAVTTERLSGGLTVIHVDGDAPAIESTPGAPFTKHAQLTIFHQSPNALTVQVLMDGSLIAWNERCEDWPVGKRFVAYQYRGPRNEALITDGQEYPVPVLGASNSYFGVTYFRDLSDAIIDYGQTLVRDSVCPIFRTVWRDAERLVFLPAPEADMRRSLQFFLRNTLRDYSEVRSVMPEQNVNESRPVDIKVVWSDANRIALIEIKWLGISMAHGSNEPSSRHSQARALEGAQQLADYLDLYRKEAPQEETRGYLVVFDGRRRGVASGAVTVTHDRAYHYEKLEIAYDESVLAREDFARPLRLFCAPRLTASV